VSSTTSISLVIKSDSTSSKHPKSEVSSQSKQRSCLVSAFPIIGVLYTELPLWSNLHSFARGALTQTIVVLGAILMELFPKSPNQITSHR